MPPNKKGGKNYKKGKHVNDEPVMYERQEDQIYGRVLKLLGGCNALVYCNDGRERLCHIRGSMRKKVWIDPGDIVLLSLRDMSGEGGAVVSRGDICLKYDPRVFQRLRDKDETINPKLFTTIEKHDSSTAKAEDDGEGFVFEQDASEDASEDSSQETTEARQIQATARSRLLDAARAKKEASLNDVEEDVIDVDNI